MSEVDDIAWLKEAYLYARDFSFDPRTQNGAVIVQDVVSVLAKNRNQGSFLEACRGQILLSYGVNRVPFGVKRTPERHDRQNKSLYIGHAERIAIYDAARRGVKLFGAIMYCPWIACAECAQAIIESGIKEVVGHDLAIHSSRLDWQRSIDAGHEMMLEAGVLCRKVKADLGMKILFNGELIDV